MTSEEWGCGCGADCFTLDEDGFTCRKVLDAPEVWRVELLMHDTFLPSVNAFVLRDGADALVVDAGTSDDFNDTRLMRALLGLGVDPERTTLFCTHGHVHAPDNPPALPAGSAFLSGHTHVKTNDVRDGITFVNPGSVSLPKVSSR